MSKVSGFPFVVRVVLYGLLQLILQRNANIKKQHRLIGDVTYFPQGDACSGLPALFGLCLG